MTQQSLRQASVRAATGTANPYEGDWHALFDAAGIAPGPFDQRLLVWINGRLGIAYPDLPGAQQAFAAANGAYDWASLGAFSAGGGSSFLLLENGSLVLLEDGSKIILG
ncbi:MAG: hypothetical protein JWM33_2191 [Caulobacteraceae bacterium]|nr:hypothetical protein [Caulobacteraceae bacterium]